MKTQADSTIFAMAQRVKRGVRLLDAKVPGWRRVLRRYRDELDLADGSCCVLGTLEHHSGRMRVLAKRAHAERFELAPGYARATTFLAIDGEAYGFNIAASDSEDDTCAAFRVLQTLWLAEIA